MIITLNKSPYTECVAEMDTERGDATMTDGAEAVNAMKALSGKIVENVMHNGDLWYTEGHNRTVMDAVKDMLTDNTTHHRVFVCESLKDTRPTGIMSQFDVIQMMWDHKVEFGPLLHCSVKDLGLCSVRLKPFKPAPCTTL